MDSIWTNESTDTVRFYFNYLTGAIDHTGNNLFLLSLEWVFIGIFVPATKEKIGTIVTEDKSKWNIYVAGKFHMTHYMTETQIAAYKAYIVKKVSQTLTN